MDIKDFILIGGGLLIAAVVAHGFWIAWRDRRQDLRIDIKPDLIPDDEVDEIDRLRGELPNGGGRLVQGPDPEQSSFQLEPPPLLLEPSEQPREARAYAPTERATPSEVEAALLGDDWQAEKPQPRTEPVLDAGPAAMAALEEEPFTAEPERPEDAAAQISPPAEEPPAPAADDALVTTPRAKVADVAMPEPIVADEPKRPRRLGQRKAGERSVLSRRGGRRGAAEDTVEAPAAAPVEELVVMNVLAESDRPYTGDELFAALRTCGLKFGDMNIFHRVEPLTKSVQYSVASAVEPGTFDMADMEAIRCPGLCLFMQLPGPEEPLAAFEDMLSVARSIVGSLGGELRDEHRNIMTAQTVEHYRQRIVDFSRRRMSKRA
ncbi:MAG: cell division protein ZipA [Pseudomonadota bacterium]